MFRLPAIVRGLSSLFRRRSLEADMAAELQGHIDALIERNIVTGMSPEEARRAARHEFGGVEQIKERARDERVFIWLEQVWRDVRYGARALRKAPSFTITAVLTLGFGIGVNAALFTLYDAVALRSLPVADPDGLVKIAGRSKNGGIFPGFSYAEYAAYRDRNRVLSGLVAINEATSRLSQDVPARSDPVFEVHGAGTVPVQWVSDNYFSVFGGRMILGRGFLPEENRARGGAAVVVLSHLFWERHLHSDPNVIGKTIVLGRPYTVIGVTDEAFTGQQPAPPAAWIPLMMWGDAAAYGPHGPKAFRLVGRLMPGVSEQQAKADLDTVAAQLAIEIPDEREANGGPTSVQLERGMRLIRLPLDGKRWLALAPILLGFGMVLMISCTNVANLLLARGVMRQQEIGVRLTLGAGRGRVIRQLFTENLLLCTLGAAIGLAFAIWTLQALQPIVLGQLPAQWAAETRRWHFLRLVPDVRVLGFTTVLTLTAALTAGLLPALQGSKANIVSTLKNEGTVIGTRFTQTQLRHVLIVFQVSVCLMLLSCAGLLARNLFSLKKVDLGFDPSKVYAVSVPWRIDRNRSDLHAAFVEQVEKMRLLPGVAAVASAYRAPLLGAGNSIEVRAGTQRIDNSFVSSGFFRTFGILLTRGREFTDAEVESGAPLAIVSEAAAQQLWPGEEPIGKVLPISDATFARPGRPANPGAYRQCEVIGVARDITRNVGDTNHLHAYLPLSPAIQITSHLYLRPVSDSPATIAEITRQAAAVGIELYFDQRMSTYMNEELLPFFGLAVLSGALGSLALLMASVGLYGVMAFSVNQRIREIGIRIALGATADKVIRLFVRQGLTLIGAGIVLGLIGGGLFAVLLSKVVFGLGQPFDPIAFGGVTVIFLMVALAACWLPARRVAKVDPLLALRTE